MNTLAQTARRQKPYIYAKAVDVYKKWNVIPVFSAMPGAYAAAGSGVRSHPFKKCNKNEKNEGKITKSRKITTMTAVQFTYDE